MSSTQSEPTNSSMPVYLPTYDEADRERQHLESILSQRFNFLIVFFGVAVSAAAGIESDIRRALLLLGAAFVVFAIFKTTERGQVKLDLLLDEVLHKSSQKPAWWLDQEASKKPGSISRRRLIGVTIPKICVWMLLIGFILSSIAAAIPYMRS